MKTNSEVLTEMLAVVVRNGEIPYQANRKVLKALDIYHDDNDGKNELIVMIEGLDVFIANVEELGDAAEKVGRKAIDAIR